MGSQPGSQTLSPLVPELVCAFWGFIAGMLVALPLTTLLNEPPILVGFIEEPAKAIAPAFLALRYPEVISTKTRGLILGGCAGLGFGVQENLWYFLGGTGQSLGASDILVRTVMDIPLHVMFSGIVGLGLVYLAQQKIDLRGIKPGELVSKFTSKDVGSFILLAMILHGLFDATTDIQIAGIPLMFFVIMFVYYRLWKILSENLQTFKFPGFVGLLKVIAGSNPFKEIIDSGSSVLSKAKETAESGSRLQTIEAKPQTAYCANCGKPIQKTASFCRHCGASQT